MHGVRRCASVKSHGSTADSPSARLLAPPSRRRMHKPPDLSLPGRSGWRSSRWNGAGQGMDAATLLGVAISRGKVPPPTKTIDHESASLFPPGTHQKSAKRQLDIVVT